MRELEGIARVVIEAVKPEIDGGRFPVKRTVGEEVEVEADIEGEPARPLSKRRLKRSPLRDVAGMIRSFHYAAHAALLGSGSTVRPEDRPVLEYWAHLWYLWVSATFLRSYLAAVSQAGLLPEDREDLRVMLDAYVLEKAVYELGYELNNRLDWVRVPLRGILRLLGAEG